MMITDGGGAMTATKLAPPPPPPKPPPPPRQPAVCDTVRQTADPKSPSLFDSLFHTAAGDAASAWHAASADAASVWKNVSPHLEPVKSLASGAYDFLLKSDVDGVLGHQQTAKDLITTLTPGGSALSTAIGTAQNYFGSNAHDHGGLVASFTDSLKQNNAGAAALRLASHPGETLSTGFHMAMLASWLIPGAGEAADAGVHVAIAGGRSALEHVGLSAVRDVAAKGVAAFADHVGTPLATAGKKLLSSDAQPLLASAAGVVDRTGSKVVEATKLAEPEVAQTLARDGRVFWTGGERAQQAATAFAQEHGLKTLGMTKLGAYAERREAQLVKEGASWPTGIRRMWELASTVFAKNTAGAAHVFIRDNPGLAQSIWTRVELPILEGSKKVEQVVKHAVF